MSRELDDMADYSDYRVWKDVELLMGSVYLSDYEEYTEKDIASICMKLMCTAKEAGLKGCYLKFNSTRDPHDDFLGPVEVIACGFRRVSEEGQKEQQKIDLVNSISKFLGLTPYEVKSFLALEDSGALSRLMGAKSNERGSI
jgi:hypothetical protein